MHGLDLVIFHLAGTTVEDRGEVPAAFAVALAGHGIVVTGEQIKGVRGSSKLLGALGWAEGVVDAVVCGGDVALGRPAPYLIFRAMESTGVCSVHRVANVGDTTLDLQAGHNAGVRWNIGVLSGAHDRQTLENAPHTHIHA